MLTLNSISSETTLRNEGETEIFSNEEKQKQFVANRSILKGNSSNEKVIIKEFLEHWERNNSRNIDKCNTLYFSL